MGNPAAPIAATILLLASAGRADAEEATSRDATLKAVTLYNFARFAAWPPTRFASPSAPVTLCASPSSGLAPALSKLSGQPVGARRLAVRLTQHPGAGCHLAYLEGDRATAGAIAALHEQGVLTVGEDGGPKDALAVTLVTVGRQLRFQVNVRATRSAGVTISSQLLRLAVLVRS